MHFWKSAAVFFGLVCAGVGMLLTGAQPAQASPVLRGVYSATVPTSTLGTIRQIRVDQADGTAYVLGNGTEALGVLTPDGSTYRTVLYSTALPTHSVSDLAVSQGKAFIVLSGSTHAIYRYDVSGVTATFVASSTLGSGTPAVTLGGNSLYVSKGTTVYTFDTDVNSTAPNASASSSISRLSYADGRLLYLSSAGRFASLVLGLSDTTLLTGGPGSATAKGLTASSDGRALYYASNTGFNKLSIVSSASLLWTRPLVNVAAMDVSTSTGRITLIDTSGLVTTYDPINPVASFTSSASGTNTLLSWDTNVFDSDFGGVTIRRSQVGYPASATDGVAVTSSDTGVSFVDSDLDEGTYYYSIFNQTMDGYYSSAVTSTVTINLPPSAPTLFAEATGSTVTLSWTVPPDTASFVLRRGLGAFPTSHTDGIAVTSTDSSITTLTENGRSDDTYFYGLFAADAGGNYSAAGTATVIVDTTPPSAPVLAAMTSSSDVMLSWDVPATTVSFLLRRSTSVFPTSISEGVGVTSTVVTMFTDTSLSDATYYYSLFAADSLGNYSSAGTASVAIDTTGPSAPTSFSAFASGDAIHLSWSNPADTDFDAVLIRRSPIGFPSSLTDGTAVTSTIATSYTDPSLADSTYYYSLFALDTTGNVSVQATSSATVNTYVAPPTPTPSSGGGGGGGAVGGGAFSIAPSIINLIFPSNTTNNSLPLSQTPAYSSAQNAPPVSLPNPKPMPPTVFIRPLRQGISGADVKSLQVFLNAHGFMVAKNGPGSRGRESTFFGPATTKALKKFQEAYKDVILKPYHLKQGTGVLGTNTMALIQTLR